MSSAHSGFVPSEAEAALTAGRCSDVESVHGLQGVGWVRCGEAISYYANTIKRKNGSSFYTFTVTVQVRTAPPTR